MVKLISLLKKQILYDKIRIILPLRIALFPIGVLRYRIKHLMYRKFHSKKLRCFKDKYKSQTCFIIGNGPSLTVDDLNSLKNQITFAVNGIFHLIKETDFEPSFYCVSDQIAWAMNKQLLKDSGISCPVFLNYGTNASDISNEVFYFFLNFPFSLKPDNDYGKNMMKTKIESNFENQLYASYTVIATCIQLAFYMGFSRIFLIGADCDYLGDKKYAYGSTPYHDSLPKGDFIKSEERQQLSYRKVKEYADAKGVAVFNATRGGKLEVFPRADFDEVLKNVEAEQ